jgi:putative peptidoglycan lipid II flippase
LVALAALAMGMLNAKRRFGVPASASMMFNIGSILGGLLFAWIIDPRFGPQAIIGISIGTLIGGAAQLLIQVPSLRAVGFRYQPLLDWRDDGFRRVVKLVGPSVIGVAAVQINVFVNNWFASYFENGAVTWLNCAFRLMQFPIGLFGVAIATATLPAVSALVARGELDQFRTTLARSIRLAIFLSLPAACGLAVLAEPIISVIYQHGRFSAYSTEQTAACLRAFAIGLAGYAALKVLAPTFYAFGDSRTPAKVALFSIAINALLCWLFAWKLGLGVMGLALSTGLVALANFIQLLFAMRRRIARVEGRALLRSLAKVALACVLMGAATVAVQRFISVNRYIDLAAGIATALVVFGAACQLLRIHEFGELLAVLRFGKKLNRPPM